MILNNLILGIYSSEAQLLYTSVVSEIHTNSMWENVKNVFSCLLMMLEVYFTWIVTKKLSLKQVSTGKFFYHLLKLTFTWIKLENSLISNRLTRLLTSFSTDTVRTKALKKTPPTSEGGPNNFGRKIECDYRVSSVNLNSMVSVRFFFVEWNEQNYELTLY